MIYFQISFLLVLFSTELVVCSPQATHGHVFPRFSIRQMSGGGWTVVRPNGSDIFLLALNHLTSPIYYDIITGANGFAPCRSWDIECQTYNLLVKKYKNNWTTAVLDFVEHSKDWGFNSAGYEYVPGPHIVENISWPYLPDLFVTNASHIFASRGIASFPDVFDDLFNTSVDIRIASWCAGLKRSDIVGYYFEDQPLWNVTLARNKFSNQPSDWVTAIRGLPASATGKGVYIDWLTKKYNNTVTGLEAVRKVYNVPNTIVSWTELRAWGFTTVNGNDKAVVNDDTHFLGIVANQLFNVSASAIRRHDPGALVFGQRFLSNDTPKSVLSAAGRHFDVVSVQPSPFSFSSAAYIQRSVDTLAAISVAAGGKPVMVADQATHFIEPGTLQPGCPCAANQTQAGWLYAEYLKKLREQPAMVGYARCQYINRVVKAQNSKLRLKQGLLDFDGSPHGILVDAIRRANLQ